MTTELTVTMKGGDKASKFFDDLFNKLTKANTLRVGFLEEATYPPGDGGARLLGAAKRLNETIELDHPDWRPRLEAWAAWQKTHSPTLHVAQVAFWNEFGTVTSPARPFFRAMINEEREGWGNRFVKYLKANNYEVDKALALMGLNIEDALKDSIEAWPADNAHLTAFVKQFNKGLTDTGVMKERVGSEVWQGNPHA